MTIPTRCPPAYGCTQCGSSRDPDCSLCSALFPAQIEGLDPEMSKIVTEIMDEYAGALEALAR